MINSENSQIQKRLTELACRAIKTGKTVFSNFLTPQEALQAQRIASYEQTGIFFYGGWKEAERSIAAFGDMQPEEKDFPINALEITWPHQQSPRHQDLLGSVLALGITRENIGDIVLENETAWLFCKNAMTEYLLTNFSTAGKVHLSLRIMENIPQITLAEGKNLKCTVASLRLDAVIASGYHVARSDAASMITEGLVKVNYLYETKVDAKLKAGDLISVKGYGRVRIDAIGSPTKKARLPLELICFGSHK